MNKLSFLFFLCISTIFQTNSLTINVDTKTAVNLFLTSTMTAGLVVTYIYYKKFQDKDAIQEEVLQNTSVKDIVSSFTKTEFTKTESETSSIIDFIGQGVTNARKDFQQQFVNLQARYKLITCTAAMTAYFSLLGLAAHLV